MIKDRQSGQALVLGALSMLLLGLMMVLSFNLNQAIHERIRIQQHSDSQAYSMAVVEARAFNYFAYSNRAMAASYAAMTTIHAYMAAASVTGEMMQAGAYNFFVMAGLEFALCCSCGGPFPCCKIQHCIHGIDDIMVALDYLDAADDYHDKAKSVDGAFKKAQDALDNLVDGIHGSQLIVVASTAGVLMSGISELKDVNAPQASGLAMGVGGINVNEFGCAMEGSLIPCAGGASAAPVEARSKVMTEVANATRPDWAATRSPGSGFPVHLFPKFLKKLMKDIPGKGMSVPFAHGGTARISSSSGNVESGSGGNVGKNVGATEEGMLASQKHCFGMVMPYDAEVHSDTGGGKHQPGDAHEGQHNFEKGKPRAVQGGNTCTTKGNCFINFRATPDPKKDFGQPSVYSYVTQDLRARQTNSGWATGGPWELNDSGSFEFKHGEQGSGTITLPPGTGAAVSKAKVYYHKPGDWREHPNFFNPYWRAKLHPFTRGEAIKVLGAAMDTDAATAAAVGPVN